MTTARVATCALLLCAACGNYPRDPEGTLERVRGGALRVGVAEASPWTSLAGGTPAGVEPALVQELARELGARVEWVPGSETLLLEALERGELDLVVGGLDSRTPWKRKRIAITDPYYTDTLVVGLPPGSTPLDGIEGREIAVEVGDPAGHWVREKGGVPVYVRDLAGAAGPVAAPTWRLDALGREGSGITLHEAERVMGVPRGENAFLVRVEHFLADRKKAMPSRVRDAAR